MKKKTLLLGLIIFSLLALFSCTEQSDVPTGMQLVKGGEDVGYYMYVHSEWTVSNIGDIASAHVSTVDTTSVSMVEIETPEDDPVTPEAALVDYFMSDKNNFPYEINVLTDGEICSLGNIDRAYKFIFEFTYKDLKFKEMQILATYGERSYIFSYQSSNEKLNEEITYFDYHMDKIKQITEKIKFVDKNVKAPEKPADPDGDGYYLASDKRLSGFELYIPIDYECEFSSGMVSASVSEGANISLVKATGTGVSVADYYKARKEQLQTIVDSFTPISEDGIKDNILGDGNIALGLLTKAASYEYTYTYNGEVYHVYQVLAVDSFNGYVFTYTAKESEFSAHLDEIKEIIKRIRF